MSLEATIAALTAAIEENTRTMRELAAPQNVTVLPVKTTKAKASPAVVPEPEKPAPVVEETTAPEAPAPETPTPETPSPVVEETSAPVVEESAADPAPEAAADDDYDSWDEPKLRLAIQEFCKTKLISADSASFKTKFGPALQSYGVEKAAKLPADKLAEFYRAALTW